APWHIMQFCSKIGATFSLKKSESDAATPRYCDTKAAPIAQNARSLQALSVKLRLFIYSPSAFPNAPNPSACPPSSITMESSRRLIICLVTVECMCQSFFAFSALSVNANAERQVESPCKQQLSVISWPSRRKDCTALHFPCIINVSRRLLASSSRPPKQW